MLSCGRATGRRRAQSRQGHLCRQRQRCSVLSDERQRHVVLPRQRPANGLELWKSDGTTTGTSLVKDIYVGSGSGAPDSLTNVNGTLFFSASNGVNGVELWKTSGLVYVLQASNDAQAQFFVDAVNRLSVPAVAVTVELNLAAGTYSDIIAHPPKGVTLVIKGAGGGQTVVVGHSPALSVESGTVIVQDVTLTTDTDSPTVVVADGSLTLRGSTINETSGGNQSAVVSTGGVLDLGTAQDPGGNTMTTRGSGNLVENDGGSVIEAIGNTFQADGGALASNFDIQDMMVDAAQASGSGLVSFVAETLFVTSIAGNVQAAVNAAPVGYTVHVEVGSYDAFSIGDKPVTLAFENGPTLAFVQDGNFTNLVITGTPDADTIGIAPGSTSADVVVQFGGLPAITFAPTGQIIAQGGDGNDTITATVANDLVLDGGAGQDVITGGFGTTYFIADAGNDQVDFWQWCDDHGGESAPAGCR